MKKTAALALALALALSMTGCPDDGGGDTQDATSTETSSPNDTTIAPLDTSEIAYLPDDTGVVALDTVEDAGDIEDTSGCQPFDEPMALECDGIWRYVRYWSDWTDADCPTWYTHGTDSYDTLEALAADLSCDPACLLRATNAVSVLDCDGNRTGYEVYAGAEGCGGPVYGTPIGLLEDLCDWPARSCYCDEE